MPYIPPGYVAKGKRQGSMFVMSKGPFATKQEAEAWAKDWGLINYTIDYVDPIRLIKR